MASICGGILAGCPETPGEVMEISGKLYKQYRGMGSLAGSVLAAILISLLEAYASLWVSPSQAIIVSFVVLILTLLWRPTGLFVATPK